MSMNDNIKGASPVQLRAIRSYLKDTLWHIGEAQRVHSVLQACGTFDTARRDLMAARERCESAVGILDVTLEPRPWCPSCGDGAPGKVTRLTGHGLAVVHEPCPKCVKRLGDLDHAGQDAQDAARLGIEPADEGMA